MKKIVNLLIVLLVMITIAGCTEPIDITLSVDVDQVTIKEGEDFTLGHVTNDTGVTYSLSETGVITISDEGKIEAIKEGEVTITITSVTDESISKTVSVSVRKEITLSSETLEIELEEEQTHQLAITSNDAYEYEVVNGEVVSINTDGLIEALNEGSTTINVTSTYDETKTISITINVTKKITLDINKEDYVMVVGDTQTIDATSNDGLTYVSGSNGIVTVNESGLLEATGFGTTTVKVQSTYNEEIFEYVDIQVYKYTEEIEIEAPIKVANNTFTQLTVDPSPLGAFAEVTWEVSDETVATIDESGMLQAIAPGSVDVIAKSTLDTTIVDTITIEVINMLLVKSDAVANDVHNYEGVDFTFGEQLFSTIDDAINNSIENTLIYVLAGTYADPFEIDVDGIEIKGIEASVIISGAVMLTSSNTRIENVQFTNSTISNSTAISNFTFINNEVTSNDSNFMNLNHTTHLTVTNNTFHNVQGTVLTLSGLIGGNITIEENEFMTSTNGIVMNNFTAAELSVVKVFFNKFDGVDNVFNVDFMVEGYEATSFKAARFNVLKNYTKAIETNEGSTFDFTLNYFDDVTESKFINVTEHYTKGAYETEASVLQKSKYNPTLPIIIEVVNPIEEIMIGETHTFSYEILPYELSDAPVRFITGNPNMVAISQDGAITPLISGSTYIQVRSALVSSIRTQTNFSIITTPGIEMVPDHYRNNLVVGDTMSIDTILFPYTIENESVVFTSSDESIATINQSGDVTTVGTGTVTFRATLSTDSEVYTEYTISVHNTLDMMSPIDYMTYQQVSYSTIHNWTAQGFQYNYHDTRAESVSRYYFGDVLINDSKMVPENSYGIRPTEPMDPLPNGVTGFNPENIYWVVVHDTASSATGSDALAHANYLYNNAVAGTALWVSWHYTIDDQDVYQHLPENERGYHAGDGSTNPGEGSYLGGGNRNGVGIEMSINDDGDMMRTWQRTAKLVVDILNRNNMPITQYRYHQDFSGKKCPNTLITAGLTPLFEEFVEIEYKVTNDFSDTVYTFTSHNPEILDNNGRIMSIPARAVTVSYTITATTNGITESRTFYTYVPGSVR